MSHGIQWTDFLRSSFDFNSKCSVSSKLITLLNGSVIETKDDICVLN